MLEKNALKRAILNELIECSWVTNKGSEKIEIDKVDIDDPYAVENINRVI